MGKAKQKAPEGVKELKTREIFKLMYCGESTGITRLVKAKKEGIVKSTRIGYYEDTPELRAWIAKWAGDT